MLCRRVSGTCCEPQQQQSLIDKEIQAICIEEADTLKRYVPCGPGSMALYQSVTTAVRLKSDIALVLASQEIADVLQQATHVLCTIPPSSFDTLVKASLQEADASQMSACCHHGKLAANSRHAVLCNRVALLHVIPQEMLCPKYKQCPAGFAPAGLPRYQV